MNGAEEMVAALKRPYPPGLGATASEHFGKELFSMTLNQVERLGKRLFESLYKGGKTD
jgi:hypothetical protein